MKAALAISLLFAACTPASDGPGDPELSPEEQQALEDALSGADDKADGFGLTLYTTEYKNLTIAGETSTGRPFALVAGKHERNFPYFNRESEWDSLLLLVDDQALSITARDLATLAIDADVDGSVDRGIARLRYQGPAARADGTAAQVAFDLSLEFQRYAPLQLGKPYNVLDLDGIAGLRWRPVEVHGTNAGTVNVDGQSAIVAAVAGELEHAELTNFRAPELAFKYDYVAFAYADTSVPVSQWYGHVTFSSHALYGETILGYIMDWYLGLTAGGSMTLSPGTRSDGNSRGLDLDGPEVVISHHVDLGLADLERQLVRTTDSAGRTAFGLREIFTAK